MQNIYEVWRNFNKTQESLKGPHANAWLDRVGKSSMKWGDKSFPQGEYWKYVSFGNLNTTKLNPAQAEQKICDVQESEEETLIYINDFSSLTHIKPMTLQKGLSIVGHKDVLESEELSDRLTKIIKESPEENLLSEIPLSFAGLGLFVIVDNDMVLEKPIRVVLDLNNLKNKDSFVPYSVQLLLGEQSSATVFVETRAEQFVGFSNVRIDTFLKRGSQLKIYSKECGGSQSRTLLHNFTAIEKDANFQLFDLTLPGQWSRHNTIASMQSANSHAQLNGVYLNNENYFCDHHTEIQHLKEHTTSLQSYKGILSGSARAVFNGKVFIEKMAKKSSSEQINKNLMLSKKSEIDTKPELQIYNDDVKAAHGATIGKIDEEQLFYLQSRGYTKNQAWRALARAFVYDNLEGETDYAKKFLEADMFNALSQFEEL